MKKLFFILFLLLLSSNAFAAYLFNPNTVEEIDVNITQEGIGSFTGSFQPGDEMTLTVLSFSSTETQRVIELKEELFIGSDVIQASHETSQGNTYAVFNIPNLEKYSGNPEFKYVIKARVKNKAIANLGNDFNLSNGIKEFPAFLEATKNIESDDPELKSKALIEFTDDSFLETLREITYWVNSNVVYDWNYYNGVWSAKQVYLLRKGVCDEFANLAAAFLRAKDIPTRYNVGIVFDGEQWGNHGWLEAYLPGSGWIGVDATFNEAGYIDATHISLAKLLDADDAVDKVRMPASIDVQVTKQLPLVQINDVKQFTNLVSMKLGFPEKVSLRQNISFTAKIRNLSNKNKIIPLRLALHEDFTLDEEDKLELFKPFEEKEISWQAVSPGTGEAGKKFIYGLKLISPDNELDENIIVAYPFAEEEKKSSIVIEDVSPFIQESQLTLEIKLFNKGTLPGTARIKAGYEGKEIERIETVPALARASYKLLIQGIRLGTTLFLSIKSDENMSLMISIPEKPEEKIVVTELPEEPETSGEKPETAFEIKTGTTEEKGFDFLAWLQGLIEFIKSLLGLK